MFITIMTSLLAYPGTRTGYHALTYGLYADQLVRRVDKEGRNLANFFEDEIAIPYGKCYSTLEFSLRNI